MSVVFVGVLIACSSATSLAVETVTFRGTDGLPKLTGYLSWPRDTRRAPAVVFLHGCSGLRKKGRIRSIYTAWAEHLNGTGYAVLMVDSAGSRGIGETCGPSDARKRMYHERPGDAYAALAYLQSSPRIDPRRIVLMGWSQGGGIVLLTVSAQSIGRPSPPPRYDFSAAVAFYPSACSVRHQSSPYTTVAPGTWRPVSPLLVLQGGADNWTKPEPCVAFIEAVRKRGHPARIILYPDAVHSFDVPNLSLQQRLGSLTEDGQAPLIGTNEPARRDAYARVLEFLREHVRGD